MLLLLAGCGTESPDSVELTVVPNEAMANRILYELSAGGVAGAQRESATLERKPVHRILVPTGELTIAREILVKRNLPRDELGGFEQMLSTSGMIPTATDERARLMFALSQELSRTIEAIDGVNLARVHVYLPEQSLLSIETTRPASPNVAVLVKHDPSRSIDPKLIKDLVRGALPDVAEGSVQVVIVPTEPIISRPMADLQLPTAGGARQATLVKIQFSVIVALTAALLFIGGRMIRRPREQRSNR